MASLTNISYDSGNLKSYLAAAAAGLRRGLGASAVVVAQGSCFHSSSHLAVSAQSDTYDSDEQYADLVAAVMSQTAAVEGLYDLNTTYYGVPLRTPRQECCGAVLALRPSVVPFQESDRHALALMAHQLALTVELDRYYQQSPLPGEQNQTCVPAQDRLLAVNQALSEKLDRYQAELDRISAQLQVENVVHFALEQRFQKIFEGSSDAILVIDLQNDRILEANARSYALLAYSRRELVSGVCLSQLFPTEDIKLSQLRQSALDERHGWTAELTCLTKTNIQRLLEISAAPLELEGKRCLVVAMRDIRDRSCAKTHHKLTELAEVGTLASMIVHEIRNPLTTVIMSLSSFQSLELNERFQARLNFALEEAHRLERLLKEILTFSKPQVIQTAALDLISWSKGLVASLEAHPMIAKRAVRFCSNTETLIIPGDCDKLKQVFINIVTNACEAVEPGAPVFWNISHQSGEDYVDVTVRNGGAPISPEILHHLTQPFFTTKSEGSGLGLAIVKRIVEAHRGHLHITSELDLGTTVVVRLPIFKQRQ